MSTECLDGFIHEVIGTVPTAEQEERLESLTADGDLICEVLECGSPGCSRENGVIFCGDGKLELLRGVAAGVCARRKAAEQWQLEQALLPYPRSPLSAAQFVGALQSINKN